ncbi:MAG: 2-succinyl-5-enolpyruvyl-6-hydroxy-3-cyclohexene-carboxylic-acid synthase [Actinomycetota bacterium]|jgi:2-succinyl-5-enolpyruvyl-6-hydroxy-3-cyclohexene-1-carboxylate synthase
MTDMVPSTRWSFEFLARLITRGITDVVMSPGSRSQSLALAAAQFEAAGLLNLHVVVDERTAGFVALGLSIETGRPAVVACTSGSSVANLHPAVVEAHHAGVPMFVVTADRPLEVRTTGGNQTTVQPGMFAGAVGGVWDFDATDTSVPDLAIGVADEALLTALTQRIPVHINPQFREPLSSPIPDDLIRSVRPGTLPAIPSEVSELNVLAMAGTVVVAGAGAGPRAERWARELGAPLIAEVNSGAHYGPHLVVNYREALSNPEFRDQITSVIVVGRPTLSRAVDVLCQSEDVDVIIVRGPEAFPYRPRPGVLVVDHIVTSGDSDDLSRQWALPWARRSRVALDQAFPDVTVDIEASQSDDHKIRSQFARTEMGVQRETVSAEMLVRAVWDVTWPHDRVVFGASSLVRVADASVPGKPLKVIANRGLNGIDGTIATAIGVARASQRATDIDAHGVTRVVLGDLAAVYDAGSLVAGTGRIQVIVGNNHGGRIFEDLEVAKSAGAEVFERVMITPQSINFEQLAGAYGWAYRRVTTRGSLTEALSITTGPVLIEVDLPHAPVSGI